MLSILGIIGEQLEKADLAHYEVGDKIVKERPDYFFGANCRLENNIEVRVFFMDDAESSWNAEETKSFLYNQLIPAFDYIEEQAKQYDVTFNLKYFPYGSPYSRNYLMVYEGTVTTDPSMSEATKDTLTQASRALGYKYSDEMHKDIVYNDYNSKEVIYLTVFNKAGTSYTHNEPGNDFEIYATDRPEHCVLFSKYNSEDLEGIPTRPSTIAYQLLLLYGAERLDKTPSRIIIAEDYYPNDIMRGGDVENINETKIDEYTAYAVGWHDSAPEVCYIKDFWKTDE